MKIAVVDGHSTGRALVSVLLSRGAACVHVQTSPHMSDYFTRGFRPDDYEVLLDGTAGPAALARELRDLHVDRVIAGTESGVTLADTLNHLMGLPGNRYETLAARRDKQLMGETAAAAGVRVPLSGAFADADAAVAWYEAHCTGDAVVKPPSSAGSDNVRFCRTPQDVQAACKAVLTADDFLGRPNEVALVQERVLGTEYYANTVSYHGVHRVAELWRYTKRTGDRGSPVYDYEEPVPIASAEAAPIRRFVGAVLDALGVENGAAHTEVMVTPHGPVLIESGARLGGGTAPHVVERYSGISQTRLLAETLMVPEALEAFDDSAVVWHGAVRNVALVNSTPGTVRSLDWTARVESLPTLVHLAHSAVVGRRLPETTDLLTSPGYVYLAAEDPQDVRSDYERLRAMESEGLYLD
jgi:biotin carboxylase